MYATISLNTSDYTSALNDASEETNNFGKTTETQASKFSTAWSAVSVAVGTLISGAVSKVVSAITSSIDSAIARVDTLNNYTTVMTGLGYSAEEAEAAITALTEGIQGLPTTLPDIVSTQQQFAALSGDIEEATELTLALNNATLAGGQGQTIANSALSQWYQIIANGTPDLQSWRIINQAMPAQLKQIAQAILGTNATATDLFNSWQDGTVSTEQVTAAIVQLNEEGLEGFTSFAEQAQTASGGIATSMTNIQTAITSKLASVIEAMNGDSGRITSILDTIKQSISGIDADALSDSLSGAVERIANALASIDLSAVFTGIANGIALVVDALVFLIDNFDTLLPIITGVTAAMVAFKAATAISSAIDNFSTALQKGKTAFQALTAAMNANPFILIATLIAGVVAALVTLWNTNEDFRNAVISIWGKIKEFFSSVVDTIVSFFTETIPSAIDTVSSAFSSVVAALSSVVEKIVGFFTETIPSAVNATVNAVVEFFTVTVPEAILSFVDSVGKFFTETIPGFFNSLVQWFVSLPEQIAYWLGVVVGKMLAWEIEVWNWVTTAIPQLIDNIVTFFSELPGKIWDWLLQTIVKISQWILDVNAKVQDIRSKVIDAISTFFSELPGKIWNWLLQTIVKISQWILDVNAKIQDIRSQVIEAIATFFSELPGKVWNWLVQTVSKIGDFITDMGTKISTTVPNLIETFLNFFRELPSKIKEIGTNIVNGLLNGIKNAWSNLISSVNSLFSSFVSGIKKGLGISSPSKVFAEIGGFMAEGLGEGWDDEFSSIKRDIEDSMDFGTASISTDASGLGSSAGGVTVVQNIYSEAKTAAALMREARHAQERAVLLGV